MPLAKCEVYRMDLGGGFGRRGGTQDYVHQAVAIAKEFPDTPVKLIWSREEDQAHDFYRPISQCRMSAGFDDKGEMVGLNVRVSGQSINAYMAPWDVFWFRVQNFAAMTFTLGLAWPWVQVRKRVFMLKCLDFAGTSSLSDLTASDAERNRTDAVANSVADFFDLDFGL